LLDLFERERLGVLVCSAFVLHEVRGYPSSNHVTGVGARDGGAAGERVGAERGGERHEVEARAAVAAGAPYNTVARGGHYRGDGASARRSGS
jgi:hypothetical protein